MRMAQVLGSNRSVGRCSARRRIGVPAQAVRRPRHPCERTVRASAAEEPGDASGSGEPPKRPHPEMDAADAAAASSSSVVPDTLPYLGSQSDWREFRAKLVSQSRGQGSTSTSADEWAHIIPKPEKGALLLAHPLLFQNSQTYFHRAAILLLEHGDNGSYGVILNRPSTYFIRDIPLKRPQTQFNDCRLYVGGDVGGGEVQVLHPHGDLAGAVEVVKGVYMGGLDAGRDAIDAGKAQAQDFRWFSAYAGWAPGQLAMECKRGVWFTAAASPKLLLKEVEHGQGPSFWHELMTLLGGDYAELSKGLRKHDDLDAPEPSS